jgi:amidase
MTDRDTAPHYSGPELCTLPARTVVAMLKSGEISPTEVLDAALDRIASVEPAVNAMPILCADRARESLEALADRTVSRGGEAGFLFGLPVAIKDLNLVSGVLATYGNVALKDNVATESEPLVERLEERGGIIVGKTNTPEFGAGGNTFNDVFSYTRNPWNTARNAGGSSGGAAVSLATGEVWLSHGSDLAGSLRTPTSCCGVVGLRPTPGRAGGGPAAAAFLMEGLSGPMARDIEDTALFLDAMTGYDPRMPISIEAPASPFSEAVKRADGRVRIAFSPDQNGFAPVEPEIRAILGRAVALVERNGGIVEETCPDLPDLYETYVTLRGIHYGAINARLPAEVRKHFKKTLRENVETGRSLTADRIYDAMRNRTTLYHAMRTFLEDFDVLAIPVIGLEPGPVEEEFPASVDGRPVTDYVDWLRFSFLATVTTLPALSLPVGRTASGLPVGLQLVGQPRGEARLLQVARAVEEAVAFPKTPIDPVIRHPLR